MKEIHRLVFVLIFSLNCETSEYTCLNIADAKSGSKCNSHNDNDCEMTNNFTDNFLENVSGQENGGCTYSSILITEI